MNETGDVIVSGQQMLRWYENELKRLGDRVKAAEMANIALQDRILELEAAARVVE